MPFVPVANCVEAELRFTYDSQKCENTLTFLGDVAPDSDNMIELGEALVLWWRETASARCVGSMTMRECYLADLSTATGPAVTVSTGLPQSGAINLEGMPGNTAACISFHTGFRGRSFRGRNYLLGIDTGDVTINTLSTAYLDAYVGYYEAMNAACLAVGWTHVVVSRFSGTELVDGKRKSIPREEGLHTPVLSYSFTDNTVDSMRGRLPNH